MNPTGDEFHQEVVLSEKHFHEHNFAGFQVPIFKTMSIIIFKMRV